LIPVLVRIGPFTLYSFGLMAALAFLAGRWTLLNGLEKRGIRAAKGEAYTWAALLGGLVGAHLYYVIENWNEIRGDLGESLFSGAGLVWYGGVIGGTVAALLVVRARKHPLGSVADAFGPALAITYVLGRVGCQLAGDGDYGSPSDLPWAMSYPNGVVPTTVRVHPTPVYESLAMLAVFFGLRRLERRSPPPGLVFWSYLGLASMERFLVEFVRVNPVVALGLTTAQLISLGGVAAGAAGIVYLRRRRQIV
jgi:phosphatidylglycerol:prolipoprotein diacylglycerol transferase